MIRTLIDLILFLNSLSGFLVALVFWAVVAVTFSKFIKRHATSLYWIFGVMGGMTLLPILNLFGVEMGNVIYIPVLGDIFVEFTYATYFIHPVLFIIMYMGAFSPKIPSVGKLMSIRKELSIIVGFAVIPHALKRILMTLPHAWNYFADYETLLAQDKIVSPLGQSISNGVFLLGVLMTILFVVLWVTSFGGIRKRMGFKKWKRVQRWSYALYAMLFIHSVGIDTGSLVTYWDNQKRMAKVEVVADTANTNSKDTSVETVKKKEKPSFLGMSMKEEPSRKGGNHDFSGKFKFSNVVFSTECKCITNIFILVALYGSYLYFRLRKAKKDRIKKNI